MIRVNRVSYIYPNGIAALREISVEIGAGESVVVIGANGSGKTTLARCLNGLIQPQSGSVVVDGLAAAEPHELFDLRRRIGMVFQNPDDQLVSTTVESEIAFGLENLGVPTAEMRQRVEETLRRFDLARYRLHPPHLLSGGEKQRLAIAACLALRPAYLVLDEPTALLDPLGRREVVDILRALRLNSELTTVHITQSPDEAVAADRLLVLDQGRLWMDATPVEVFARGEELQEIGLGLPFAAALSRAIEQSTGSTLGPALTIDALAPALADLCTGGHIPASSSVEATNVAPPDRLKANAVWHAYETAPGADPHQALRGVTAAIPVGGVVALMGPSGSGKSTLAQHFNALLKPDRGQVLLDGEDIWKLPDATSVRRRVGLVFQFPELQLFDETVAGDVAFGPSQQGRSESEIERLVTTAMELVHLPVDQFGQRSPLSLSGGERRRAAIAGVLAMEPEVLILDEPTAGLDPRTRKTLVDVLSHLHKQGKALVLITHDMDLAAELATEVIVLTQGEVALAGATRAVLADTSFAQTSGLEPPPTVTLVRALAALGCQLPRDLLRLSEVVDYLAPRIRPVPGEQTDLLPPVQEGER